MERNIDNMTMAEIKDYVKKLEENSKRSSNMICKYLDFMASVEKFENELKSWYKFYSDRVDEKRDAYIMEENNVKLAYARYREEIYAFCAVNTIHSLYKRIVERPSI